MTTLNAELRTFYEARQQQIPTEIREIMQRAGQELADSGQVDRALIVGDKAPPFSLPSATGQTLALDDLLADGPVVKQTADQRQRYQDRQARASSAAPKETSNRSHQMLTLLNRTGSTSSGTT